VELVPDGESGHELKALAQLAGAGGAQATTETFREADRLAVVAPDLALTRVRAAFQERDWSRAIREAESTRFEGIGDSQFQFLPPRLMIGLAELRSGDETAASAAFADAAIDLESRLEESPDDERLRGALGLAYAGLGRSEDALREVRRGVELMPVEQEAWRGVFRLGELAAVHAWVGNADSAIAHLDALLSIPGELSTDILRHEPAWDPLRDDPAFEAMLTRHEQAGG
jgi:serine/threonine-protein kinase